MMTATSRVARALLTTLNEKVRPKTDGWEKEERKKAEKAK